MPFKLPELPYPADALMPHMSPETLQFHYGKHHKAYVDKLNELIQGTEFEKMDLEEIMRRAKGSIFNNAAQNWNHTFFWHCLATGNSGEPSRAIEEMLNKEFGSVSAFKEKFTQHAIENFGSGWTWLIKNRFSGRLEVTSTANAECPLTDGHLPLLACDVWEHAYYLDYRNDRGKFLEAFWQIVNWKWVASIIETGAPSGLKFR